MKKLLLFFVVVLLSISVTAYAAGCNTNSANFGSSNSSKSLTSTSNFGIDGGAITIQFWVKILTEPSGSTYAIASQHSATTKTSYEINYADSAGTKTLSFTRCRSGTACTASNYTVTLGTANWHAIVMTYDTTNIRGYVDGTLRAGPTAASGTGSSDTSGFQIGMNSASANYTSALIDDVRVFNTAISAGTISTDYSAPAELVGNEANLQAYYTFDTSLTADLTANAFNLTNNGTVTQSATVPFVGTCPSAFNFWQFWDF